MSDESRTIVKWILAWNRVYMLNLPLSLCCGLIWTSERGGLIGMLVAVWFVWACGSLLMSQPWRVRSILLTGGCILWPFQLIGIIHIVAGAMAIEIGKAFISPLPKPIAEPISGFIITIIMAQLCIGFALLIALPFEGWIAMPGDEPPPPPAEPSEAKPHD